MRADWCGFLRRTQGASGLIRPIRNASSSPTDAAAEGEGPFEETRLGNHPRIELSRVVRRVEGLPELWPLTPLCSGLLPEFPIDLVKKLAKLGIQKKIGDTSHRYLLFIDVVFFYYEV